MCEIRSATGSDSNQRNIRHGRLLSAAVNSDDAAIIPQATRIKFIAMNLHCIASVFKVYAWYESAKIKWSHLIFPLFQMIWHDMHTACTRQHMAASARLEKSIWMFQPGCRQSCWQSEASLPSKCLLHSLMVIEKWRSFFSRLAPCTLLFMKHFCRQGNAKQAGRPQFVSASRLRCR